MSYVADPELESWRSRQEVKEAIERERQLAERLRCPVCEDFGVWFMVRVKREGVFVEGPVAYCSHHCGSVITDSHDPLSYLSLNWCGWLADGSTWEEGWPSW